MGGDALHTYPSFRLSDRILSGCRKLQSHQTLSSLCHRLILLAVIVAASRQSPMNPQENRDYERRLQELEAELNKDKPLSSVEIPFWQPLERYINRTQVESIRNRVVNWFNSLPNPGKVAVVAIAAIVGVSLFLSVLQLVASLISLAILGVILYLVYKFFVTPPSPK